MVAVLQSPDYPISMLDGFTRSKETKLIMQCHHRLFKDVDVRDESNELLFTVTSETGPLKFDRIVKDATGTRLFVLNHKSLRSWHMVLPDRREVCVIKRTRWFTAAFEVQVHNLDDKGKTTIISVVPKDKQGLTTLFMANNALIAESQLVEANPNLLPSSTDRTVWNIKVAGGIDLSLVGTQACKAFLIRGTFGLIF